MLLKPLSLLLPLLLLLPSLLMLPPKPAMYPHFFSKSSKYFKHSLAD